MASASKSLTPCLASFLSSLSSESLERLIENFINLLKRRQIRGSRPCAFATARLLKRVVGSTRGSDPQKFIQRVQEVGRLLVAAQPKELVVGNVVRRVLGVIRDEEDEKHRENEFGMSSGSSDSRPQTPRGDNASVLTSLTPNGISPRRPESYDPSPSRPPLLTSHTGYGGGAPVTSMFSILNHPTMTGSGKSTPTRSGSHTPVMQASGAGDLRTELNEAIDEIIDELNQSDEQIANYAVEYISPNQTILTHSSSLTVQRFLLKAASKRKFTVFLADAHSKKQAGEYAHITGKAESGELDVAAESFHKPLTAAGIKVVLIPDSDIFAVMPRMDQVILGAHAVLGNGSFLAPAGSHLVALVAKKYSRPVVVLGGTYKLSPKYPHAPDSLLEYVAPLETLFIAEDSSLDEEIEVENPIFDFVPHQLVSLFITNLGGHAPNYIYRIVKDQYREEDLDL